MNQIKCIVLIVCGCLALSSGKATAALLYYDAFPATTLGGATRYNDASSFTSQNPADPNLILGHSAAWVPVTGGTSVPSVGTASARLTGTNATYTPTGSDLGTGLAGFLAQTTTGQRYITRDLPVGLVAAGSGNTTIWASGLIGINAASGTQSDSDELKIVFGGAALRTINNNISTSVPGVFAFGYSRNGGARQLVAQGGYSSGATLVDDTAIATAVIGTVTDAAIADAAGAYAADFLVLKVERNFSGTSDRITAYLNPTFSGLGTGVSTTGDFWDDLTDISAIGIVYQVASTTGRGGFDEIRLGTTLADVAIVPEPSTFLLCCVGMAGLLFVRRPRA